MRTSPLATWVAVCGSMLVATAANAASDYLLKIEGIDGEVAVTQTSIVSPRDAASGLPTGKRQHKPMTVISPESTDAKAAAPAAAEVQTLILVVPEPGNATSALLVRMCASGEHINKAVLTGPNLRYEMENVIVSSCAVSGNQRKIELKGHVTLMK